MKILLWIAQILLSATLLWAVYMKLIVPDQFAQMAPWSLEHPTLLKITAVFDLLAALGLILPAALRIQPKLTVYAAYGLIALMVAAIAFHISRGEGSNIGINIFMIVLAVFVIWGRTKKA